MDNNQHNPIALTIEGLQHRWHESASKNTGYKVFRWVVNPNEAVLVNGFYKVESSPYGVLPEFFLSLFTPFRKKELYSAALLSDVFQTWENDDYVKKSGMVWKETDDFKKRAQLISDETDGIALVAEVLVNFAGQFCKEKQPLVLVLIPRSIDSFNEFNDWLIALGDLLPGHIKISVIDHIGKNYLKDTCKHFGKLAITEECKDLDLDGSMKKMATSGNPNDPEVLFRKYVLEMGEATTKKDEQKVNVLGQELVLLAQKSGSRMLLATAYAVFTGFLLQFKDEKADELTDKGMATLKPLYEQKETTAVHLMIQFYGLKAAGYSIRGKRKDAADWTVKQATASVEHHTGMNAISLCRIAAMMADRSSDDDMYKKMLELGYHAGDDLPDDTLKLSDIAFLAFHYMKELEFDKKFDKIQAINERMNRIFGTAWKKNIPEFRMKYTNTAPQL
jgi:hypothetical protein